MHYVIRNSCPPQMKMWPPHWPPQTAAARNAPEWHVSNAICKALQDICIQIYVDHGSTTLTFQGHMTSSITWPFDSAYAISCWWPIGTEPLSSTVFEIFGPKTLAHTERQTQTERQTHDASDCTFCPMQCIALFANNFSIQSNTILELWICQHLNDCKIAFDRLERRSCRSLLGLICL